MKWYLVWFCFLSIISCTSPERLFTKIGEIDFSRYSDFSIIDYRESTIYAIDFQGNEYWVTSSLDGKSITRLRRKYTEKEIDSLALKFGEDSMMEDLPINTQLTEELLGMCLLYRTIWGLDPKKIYLRTLYVDTYNNAMLTIIWKPSKTYYRILIANSVEEVVNNHDCFIEKYSDYFSASSNPERSFKDEFIKINPRLHYRIIDY